MSYWTKKPYFEALSHTFVDLVPVASTASLIWRENSDFWFHDLTWPVSVSAQVNKYKAWGHVFHYPIAMHVVWMWPYRGSLRINALCACVYIYIQQLSFFRVPMLWFIDLIVTTCHIQYTFLSLCQFFSRENGQNTKILEVRHFRMTWEWLPTVIRCTKH